MPVATASVEEFLSLLEQSQLLREPLLQKVREQVPTLGADANDAERVAKSLVKSQLLSAYQALRLLSGKADGFYLGKYRLLDILGQGGMGMVYLAEQMTMNRLVALKVIGRISKNRSDSLERFRREARAVAQLSHPNIIQAYDFDEIDGIPFISMEYVEGIDVERQVAKFGPVPWSQAADYAMQAAAGLEAARQAKFVHRDIKPGNLLIDAGGTVKILDLGLVVTKQSSRNDSLTSAQDQVGTVDYMAPEQALNSHRVDIRADLYSLGGVLHFLLTGKIPFEGTSSAEKLLKHQSAAPTPVRQLRGDIPEVLEQIVLKLLAKKADDRFQTPDELMAALRPLAEKRTPPYDVSAIKHPRATFTPLLGRGPEANAINVKSQLSGVLSPLKIEPVSGGSTGVAAMKSTGVAEKPLSLAEPAALANAIVKRMPSQVTTKELSASSSSKAAVTKRAPSRVGPKSAILIVPNKAEQDDDDEFANLTTLPSVSNRRRVRKSSDKSGKSSSEGGGDTRFLMVVGGGFTLVALVAGLAIFISGGRPQQTAVASTSGSVPTTAAPARPKFVPNGPPSYDRWKTYAEELRKDPDLVAYYTFNGEKDGKDVLHSQATSPKFGAMNGKVHGGARWVPGRFPQKSALQFGGKGSGHYVSLGDGDSANCNFTTSFTIAAWFQANGFDAAHQVIVGKGDSAWRLQRDNEKNNLQLAMNNYVAVDPKAATPPPHPFARIEGLTSVNDGKWHLAVGVYDLEAARPTLTLYLDGQLEGVTKLGAPKENSFAVMIGANSEKFGNKEFRYWRGLIDEVLILNRAMKQTDIEQMYDAGRPVQ